MSAAHIGLGAKPRLSGKLLAANGIRVYNQVMASSFEELEKEIRSLNSRQKATLAHVLIEDLDTDTDENAEQLWIEEAQRRYQAFKNGEVEALPGDEVMRQARQRLK